MGRRIYRKLSLLFTVLLLATSVMPAPGRAEAQMRCAGASPRSAPCAHADIPAGLTEKQVYSTLMSCCRTMTQFCPMRSHQAQGLSSAHRCLVSIKAVTVPTALAPSRARWLLTAAPALAPPAFALACHLPSSSTLAAFRSGSTTLPPLLAPRLHGLRAPPAA